MVPCIRCGIQETACFLLFVFRVILSCLFLSACGHSLACDIFFVFCHFPIWCPGSDVVFEKRLAFLVICV